jgi:N-acetyl-1-D-myo-inositol-2-amino-2-deoxy-alpha-D-glucopyranoside deacetylase
MTSPPLTLMTVHAHPDDESIGTGGIIAKYAREGIKTVLVHCTRGEMGDVQDPAFVPPVPGMAMADIRMHELKAAISLLGIRSTHYLGYRDSGMAGHPENQNPAVFAQADVEEASLRLARIIREEKPHVVVTYDEYGVYGHPDHIMTNVVTTKSFFMAGNPEIRTADNLPPWSPKKLYYLAIPMERIRKIRTMEKDRDPEKLPPTSLVGTPEDEITTVIDVSDVLDVKFNAIFIHKSQIGPASFFRKMSEEQIQVMFAREYFVCKHGCRASDAKETDLFEGLR